MVCDGLYSAGNGLDAASSIFFTAASAAWKPILEWVPSQNGLFTDPPQRHSENAVLPVKSYGLPSASTNSIVPSGASTRNGPFLRTVIFTCAINLLHSCAAQCAISDCNGVPRFKPWLL